MRRGVVPLAFLLAAVAGFLLGRLIDPGPREPVAPSEPRLFLPESAPLPSLGSVPEVSGEADATPEMEEAPSTPATDGVRDSRADAEFPAIEVRVSKSDGSPSGSGTAYALPAGARGSDEEADLATAPVNDGVAYVRVAGPGLYDVGIVAGEAHALAHDVVVPLGGPLELRYPALAAIRFEATPEVVARLLARGPVTNGNQTVSASVVPMDEIPRALFPGRGQAARHAVPGHYLLHLLPPGWSQEYRAVPGAKYGIRVGAPIPVRGRVAEVVAPATVVVESAGTLLAVTQRFVPEARTWTHAAYGPVHFEVEGKRVGAGLWFLHPGKPLSSTGSHELQFVVPSPSGILSWSGPSLQPGSVAYSADSSGEARVEARIEVGDVPAPPPPSPDMAVAVPLPEPEDLRPRARLRAVPAEGRLPDSFQMHLTWPGGEHEGVGWDWDSEKGQGEVVFEGIPEWVVAFSKDGWAAEPRSGRSVMGGELTLRRGGHVVLVPERDPPAGLVLKVRRADRAPLTVREESDGSAVTVEPGLVIGPFVPGTLRLEFLLGGVPIGEVSVAVKAGAYVSCVAPVRATSR